MFGKVNQMVRGNLLSRRQLPRPSSSHSPCWCACGE